MGHLSLLETPTWEMSVSEQVKAFVNFVNSCEVNNSSEFAEELSKAILDSDSEKSFEEFKRIVQMAWNHVDSVLSERYFSS